MEYKQVWEKMKVKIAGKKNHILAVAAAISVAATSLCVYAAEHPKLTNADFIRLHVRANSDTYEDQALKLQVRDVVLSLMAEKMKEYGGGLNLAGGKIPQEAVKQAASYIQSGFPQIKESAESVIKQNGYDYTVKVSLGPDWIPEKTYGSALFPAGEYLTLTVAIGEAAGSNWWCVLFPPLCLIDTSPEANLPKADATKIQVKFKTAEVIEKITGEKDDL